MSSFLESGAFPVEIVNIASAKEKGPGRPPFWEMIFWWTRKPLASARAVILASLLPENYHPLKFLEAVYPSYEGSGRFSKTPHYLNPNLMLKSLGKEFLEKLSRVKLLDPFAGFGSIPLEAVRLGLGEVVATELLPTAIVFLRAILEYPKWATEKGIGKKLINDVERWGKWIIERLKEDPDIRDLYDQDVAVYIGTWEVKCPFCGKYIPLVGNWWLARVKSSRGFKNLAWMTPVKTEDGVEIQVTRIKDSRELQLAKTIKKGNRAVGIEINNKKIIVGDPALGGEPNIDAKRNKATCLYCHAKIEGVKDRWYVKEVLKEWNQNLEKYLNNEISLEELRQNKARPRLLVKVKITNKDLEFEPTTKEDSEKLWKALERLKSFWGDPDIPTEPIPPYGHIGGGLRFPTYAIDRWYQFFNPRQLLTIVKLVKLIRGVGKRVEKEKLKEGWSKEDAHKYAEAVTTYLAITLIRYVMFNSLVSPIRADTIMGAIVASSLTFRGIAMVWNFGEISPYVDITGSWIRNIKTITSSLGYLESAVSSSSSRVRILLDDATSLSKLSEERFDLIVTDPPFRDDVAYAELSDFYYVWLKRALSDSNGVSLVPRFHDDVFFVGGVEVLTQWQWFASREVSLSEGRCEYFGMGSTDEGCSRVYEELLKASFKAMVSRLSNNGLLITYFAQSSPEAWMSLIEAGLASGLYPVTAFPVLTESEESVVARGKAAITASIVVVWRRATPGEPVDIYSKYDELVEEVTNALRGVEEALSKATAGVVSELYGVTIYVMAYAKILNILTRGGRPVKAGKPLDSNEIARTASELLAKAYTREAGASLTHSDSIFYFMVKKVFPRGEEGRRLASSSDLILLSYGVTPTQREKVLDDYVRRGVLKVYGKEEETEVASRRTYLLIEPVRSDEMELSQVLKMHGVDPDTPSTFRSPVHVLHALMLYSLKPKEVFMKYYEKVYLTNPSLTAEAVELAKAISTLEGDLEAELAGRVLEYVGSPNFKTRRGVTLYDFAKR
jgi:putative DNA methylase